MVLLVDEPVDTSMVQQPVAVVEAKFLDHDANGQLPQDGGESGQLADQLRRLWGDQVVQTQQHRKAGEDLIEEDLLDDAAKTVVVDGFVGARLNLETTHEGWPIGDVQKRVD